MYIQKAHGCRGCSSLTFINTHFCQKTTLVADKVLCQVMISLILICPSLTTIYTLLIKETEPSLRSNLCYLVFLFSKVKKVKQNDEKNNNSHLSPIKSMQKCRPTKWPTRTKHYIRYSYPYGDTALERRIMEPMYKVIYVDYTCRNSYRMFT